MKKGQTAAAFLLLGLLLALAPPLLASQEEGNWEFHLFGAKAALDGDDPIALTKSEEFDVSGTLTTLTLRRSLAIEDDTFFGFRLGYIWNPYLETEASYDRNRAGGSYRHTVDDAGTAGIDEEVEGGTSAVITSYQFGALFHPLGKRKIAWQPYATLAGGWIDIDLETSSSIQGAVEAAETDFDAEFGRGDHGWLVGYGAGLKYYVNDSFAIRAEARGKAYELFGGRRDDYELSFGISIFAPGN